MTAGQPHAAPVQPSLLSGFPAAELPPPGPRPAESLPVARVCVESPLPQLDRPFDYLVTEELDAAALPGVRVKVRVAGREHVGFLLERLESSDSGVTLSPLSAVLSPLPVLAPEIAELARAVAERWAGALGDVLRFAVPPRAARVEAEFAGRLRERDERGDPDGVAHDAAWSPTAVPSPGAAPPQGPASPQGPAGWDRLRNGPAFLRHLAAGGSPRAVLQIPQGYGPAAWPHTLAAAVAAARSSGRGALVVVPDRRDLLRLHAALEAALPGEPIVRLSAEDGPSTRSRGFLDLLTGAAHVAVGTRGAAFAPVQDLGLVACWDDGDDLHVEPRAPYFHAREVLLLRAEQTGCALLLAGHAVSVEAERLVESGWLHRVAAERSVLRAALPRITSTADSVESARDPLARIARLPHTAWHAAREALTNGPVLVQVARAGYAPSLACGTCREPARCRHCSGPLAEQASGRDRLVVCRWCGTPELAFSCRVCGGTALRRTAIGALRTAEELGRAFPGSLVVTSSGDAVKSEISGEPALVVATVGAEPVAPGGYAAALLLDGEALLRRESLRAPEEALRRWLNAAALVRPASEGGRVIITAGEAEAVAALVRWDPAGFAARELALRRELGLPPAVRIAAVTGATPDVEAFLAAAQDVLGGPGIRVAGPVSGDPAHALIFFPIVSGQAVTRGLHGVRGALAARRTAGPVALRIDAPDLL
ncbi:putative primosomal protein N' [Sinomonas cellulolyticus]|uniref:Probable replication restart protein PriA n=1 Tax=Sinomonas cellulolyticus TaxID=2801916 RepID=A0ABS1K0K3_9MICC|nr:MULTISPECIES: primosomal protein N' [Sinomonas]MBL0705199.1 primosomal protein N' [Sinomonas cellulolyticus]GHG39822.1 putative primosomal protein N' [Sinomonas sp. KCTC 49339]